MIIREQDYLMHYGVKGMKWGVRRAKKSSNDKSKSSDGLGKKVMRKIASTKFAQNAILRNNHTSMDTKMSALKERDILSGKKYVENSFKLPVSSNSLTNRFDKARKDNPNLSYDQIYKEMKVDMKSEDPDDYRRAESEWLKKHGY